MSIIFLKNETSFFELDNWKDSFANEPNKKNILLFSIAKRLYDDEVSNPKHKKKF